MGDPREPKQAIIMRIRYPDGKGGTYKPRTGKLIAQGAHASMAVFFNQLVEIGDDCFQLGPDEGWDWRGAVRPWIKGPFAKVVLKAESEEELLDLTAKAKAAGLPHALIQDHGRTEFHGVPTLTALAIGPCLPEDIDPITGHLELL